jgi:hypothetical protein
MNPISHLIHSISALSSVRIALALLTRHIAARFLSVGGLLLAIALFDIREFANVGVYLATLNIVWIAVFWRYEGLMTSSKDERSAHASARTCILIALFNLAVVGLIGVMSVALGVLSLPVVCMFVGGLAGRAGIRWLTQIATRQGQFMVLGRLVIVQSVVQPLSMIALMLTPLKGDHILMLSDVIGVLSAALYGTWVLRAHMPPLNIERALYLSQAALILRRGKSLPLFNLPASGLSVIFAQLPLLMLPLIPDNTFAGALAVAYRLLDMPTQLIGAVVTPVLLHRLRAPHLQNLSRILWAMLLFGMSVVSLYGLIALVAFHGLSWGSFSWAPDYFVDWLNNSDKILSILLGMLALSGFFAGLALAGPWGEAMLSFKRQAPFLWIQGLCVVFLVATSWVMSLAVASRVMPDFEALIIFMMVLGIVSLGRALITGVVMLWLYKREAS